MATSPAIPETAPDSDTGAIPNRVVVSYGVGQLGAQIFRDTPAVLLPIFMTTILGIPAWLSGIVVLIPKLWLIVCDPFAGSLSDRLKERHGRAPFLLAGAVLTSLSFIALFTLPGGSPTMAAVLTCVLFFVGSTAFALFSVPYLAMAAEISSDPHQRTRLIMSRMIFTSIGVFVGVGVAQPLVFALGGGEEGWRTMAFTLALVCLLTMGGSALALRRVPLIAQSHAPAPFHHQMLAAMRNRPFRLLLLATLVQTIGLATSYGVIGFMFLYALEAIWLVPAFILTMSIAGVLSPPIWAMISRRIGKERCYVLATVTWASIAASWYFSGPATDVVLLVPGVGEVGTQHLLTLLRAVLIGMTNPGFILMALSMLTDVMQADQSRPDAANEGIFAGIYSSAEKMAFALGPVVAGTVMSMTGFVSSKGGSVAQGAEAIHGIVLLYSLIPVGLQVIALLIFANYRKAMAR